MGFEKNSAQNTTFSLLECASSCSKIQKQSTIWVDLLNQIMIYGLFYRDCSMFQQYWSEVQKYKLISGFWFTHFHCDMYVSEPLRFETLFDKMQFWI